MQLYLKEKEYKRVMVELMNRQHGFFKDLYQRNVGREKIFSKYKIVDFPMDITWEEYAMFNSKFEVKHIVL